jgi:hypothetical protein
MAHQDPDGTREIPEAPAAPERAHVPLDRSSVDRWQAPRADARPQRVAFIGMAGMAMVLFLILASGTVIPWWGLTGLSLVWLGALVQGTRWFMRHPGRVLALAVGMLLLWLVVLYGGAVLLDWGR